MTGPAGLIPLGAAGPSTCPGPDECVDDLCRGRDFGLCGKASARLNAGPWGDDGDEYGDDDWDAGSD
jgi:hypothetical protein